MKKKERYALMSTASRSDYRLMVQKGTDWQGNFIRVVEVYYDNEDTPVVWDRVSHKAYDLTKGGQGMRARYQRMLGAFYKPVLTEELTLWENPWTS